MRPALLALGLAAMPAVAQPQVDCLADDLSQPELTFCAAQAFEAADGELTLAYGLAVTRARVLDEETRLREGEAPIPLEDALRDAQRAWIAYRDAACAAEALLAAGGSAQPMIGTLCLDRLTRARTEELRRFVPPD